ncbi:MAG: ATP-grasp domain-containing protein [Lachnospiraceae bacterium]|nr:ATP-grasp domain-containing protein [Lachnospiraceae bacterium]
MTNRKNCNVLILSAGRRVELIKCFRNARDRLHITGEIVAGDLSELAPALYYADRRVSLPLISSGTYPDAVIAAAREYHIALIVPTIDTELLPLAKEKERIEKDTGAKLLLSDPEIIEICRDKRKTQRFMEEHGFLVPRLYTEKELAAGDYSFPLFIKPFNGSSSINTYRADNETALQAALQAVDEPMVQDYMEGDEYTVDVFLDYQSRIISIVPRLRIAVRSGEIAKGKIVRDEEISADVRRLMEALKPIGHITVQLRKTKRGVEYIEINPRFGGGAPMSVMAGADSCEYLYRLWQGEELSYRENYRSDLTFLRFDACVMLDEKGEPHYAENCSV